jgi:hypothetical protein
MRLLPLAVVLVICAPCALSQVATTSTLDGAVTDPRKAAVPGAEIVVTNVNTAQTFKAATGVGGYWLLPSMPAGVYKVSVSMPGFRTLLIENVKIDAGVPTTANGISAGCKIDQ